MFGIVQGLRRFAEDLWLLAPIEKMLHGHNGNGTATTKKRPRKAKKRDIRNRMAKKSRRKNR